MIDLLFVSIFIQLLMFVPAFIFRTDKLTDISYSLSFIILATIALAKSGFSLLKLLGLLMVAVWGIRLGAFLFIRILKRGKDSRFDGIREDFFRFLGFWVLQGVSVWVILIPLFLYFSVSNPGFCPVGFLVWAAGFAIESIADFQKSRYRGEKWIDTGLWGYSRHPNYFGEILLWIGIYLFSVRYLPLGQKLIGLVSPLYIAILIIFVSGIPKLEASAEKKWGRLKEYRKYKEGTGVLAPRF
jgi:steroid 5-alpha reductase family enzyme